MNRRTCPHCKKPMLYIARQCPGCQAFSLTPEEAKATPTGRRTCPHCRESMQGLATTCPHCRERSDPPVLPPLVIRPPEPPPSNASMGKTLALAAGIVAVFFILFAVVHGTNPSTSTSRSAAPSTAPSPTFGNQLEMCMEMLQKTGKLDAGCQDVDRKLGDFLTDGATPESIRKKYGQ